MAKSAAEQSALFPDRMPTLPVHDFVQYTQRAIVPDYTGLWIGLVVAALGAAVLLSGAIAAFARPRTA